MSLQCSATAGRPWEGPAARGWRPPPNHQVEALSQSVKTRGPSHESGRARARALKRVRRERGDLAVGGWDSLVLRRAGRAGRLAAAAQRTPGRFVLVNIITYTLLLFAALSTPRVERGPGLGGRRIWDQWPCRRSGVACVASWQADQCTALNPSPRPARPSFIRVRSRRVVAFDRPGDRWNLQLFSFNAPADLVQSELKGGHKDLKKLRGTKRARSNSSSDPTTMTRVVLGVKPVVGVSSARVGAQLYQRRALPLGTPTQRACQHRSLSLRVRAASQRDAQARCAASA